MSEFYSIGQLSRLANCKVTTIRYYESIDLLPPPLRTEGNQRRYNRQQLKQLRFIVHCRELGFSQASIRTLVALAAAEPSEPHCAGDLIDQQLANIEQKLRRLENLKRQLTAMAAVCASEGDEACAAIEWIFDHNRCDGEH
ncbi:HTH-type transcriptional regulator ZntR [Sinobacterium norvegicum]|uniref:HTH-type transcriptional regulator ZntR n=1 Tax=Sinobacterium norvegicum TaxID=1641715 RepID=A0ABM9ACD5_9GAMM|nr:MerR family transcriptional regulator [Sinobacterium norvegicum]CAH0990642.1 HTH-type transcriptional regulator ZntR [Sinobacterium norvegicum]